ncbi:MAG TPA: phosphotransferase [Bacillota bacterium]|nr:phosphotransferase [Bacillota bacterium]
MKRERSSSGVPVEVQKAFNVWPGEVQNAGRVYQVSCARGLFALKEVEPNREKLSFSCSVICFLREKGFLAAVPCEAASNGEPFFIHQDTGYLLSPWIEGKSPDFTSLHHLSTAVNLMADLHLKGQGYVPAPGRWYRSRLGRWPHEWSQGLEEIRRCFHFRAFISELERQGEHAITMLTSGAAYQTGVEQAGKDGTLCHRDLVHHNFLMDNLSNLHIIDFEYCALELPVADVGRFFRKSLPLHGWKEEVMEQLLGIYHSVHPLSCRDRLILRAYLTFPHEWWRLAHRILQGRVSRIEIPKRINALKDQDFGRVELLPKLAPGSLE